MVTDHSDDLFDVELEPDTKKKIRSLAKSKVKTAIVAELTGDPIPEKKPLVIVPNAPPEPILLDVIEIEEKKRQIELNSLQTIDNALQIKKATCGNCGGAGKVPGNQFVGYREVKVPIKNPKSGEPNFFIEQRATYEPVEMICEKCWGEGQVTRKNSERITEMVASRHFPKTSVNINMNINGMNRDGLIGFISNA